jgi:hypothetical protein
MVFSTHVLGSSEKKKKRFPADHTVWLSEETSAGLCMIDSVLQHKGDVWGEASLAFSYLAVHGSLFPTWL